MAYLINYRKGPCSFTAANSYVLTTVNANMLETFNPIIFLVEITALQSMTSRPQVSIGTNSPNYDNIIATTTLNGTSVGQVQILRVEQVFPRLDAGTELRLNVRVAAVATTYTAKAVFFGTYDTAM